MKNLELVLMKESFGGEEFFTAIKNIVMFYKEQSKDNKVDISYSEGLVTISGKSIDFNQDDLLSPVVDNSYAKIKKAIYTLSIMNEELLINTYKEKWNFKIKKSEFCNKKILEVLIDTKEIDSINDNLTIIIKANKQQWETIQNEIRFLDDNILKERTIKGDILLDLKEKSRIYVNGLYVCSNYLLKYGYNFTSLNLNEINPFKLNNSEILFQTAVLWAETKDVDTLYHLLDEGIYYDVVEFQEWFGNVDSKLLYSKFLAQYGEVYPIINEEEKYFLSKKYDCEFVITSEILAKTICGNQYFKEFIDKKKKERTVTNTEKMFENWLNDNSNYLDTISIIKLKNIFNSAIEGKETI